MVLNKLEFDAVFSALDFITANIDSAEDQEYYSTITNGLRSIAEKAKKDRYRALVRSEVKKIIKARQIA